MERLMQHMFSVGQLVRVRKQAGGICEIVRVLPVADGSILYVIRSKRGTESIARQHDIERA
jgi:hypothetical protein